MQKASGNVTGDNNSQNLPEHIAQIMRARVSSGELQAGERFPTELELIEQYQVGRSTIRETIKLLKAENLIEIRHGVGTFISDNPGQISDPLGLGYGDKQQLLASLMETRLLIEPEIACLAAERADEASLQKLGRIIEKMEQNQQPRSDLDIEFHTAIAECTGNNVLERILPIINESIYEGYVKTSNIPGSSERALDYHRRIYQAIASGDGELARHELKDHLQQSMEDMNITRGKKR